MIAEATDGKTEIDVTKAGSCIKPKPDWSPQGSSDSNLLKSR